MDKVLIFGTFDLLHPGHIFFLNEAKKYGEIYVVIARDDTVLKLKNHLPIWPEKVRANEIKKLKIAKKVFLGKKINHLSWLSLIKPNTICLGYDQIYLTDKILPYCEKHNINTKIVRIGSFMPEKYKTSKLRNLKN